MIFSYGFQHMDLPVLPNQQGLKDISSEWILDIVWMTYQEWWMIGTDSKRVVRELSMWYGDEDSLLRIIIVSYLKPYNRWLLSNRNIIISNRLEYLKLYNWMQIICMRYEYLISYKCVQKTFKKDLYKKCTIYTCTMNMIL